MMRRSILASTTGAALAVLFAAGCSSESGKVANPVDACALLSDEEVGAAFARTFSPAESGPPVGGGEKQGAMTLCSWESPGAEVAGDFGASIRNTVFINLMVWSWPAGGGGGEGYMKSFIDAARAQNLPEPEPVTLGEAAHWTGDMMNVRQGDVTMTLSLSGPIDAAALRTAAESLARSALGRL